MEYCPRRNVTGTPCRPDLRLFLDQGDSAGDISFVAVADFGRHSISKVVALRGAELGDTFIVAVSVALFVAGLHFYLTNQFERNKFRYVCMFQLVCSFVWLSLFWYNTFVSAALYGYPSACVIVNACMFARLCGIVLFH